MATRQDDMRAYLAGQALTAMGMWIPPVDMVDDQGNALPSNMPAYQRKLQEARAEWAVSQANAVLRILKAQEGP